VTHATEGDLIRWLDGEADATEGAAFEAHSAACGECRTRLDLLRRQDAVWRRAVTVLDEVVSRPRFRFTRLAWAAGLLVLLGIGVTPARAWIVTWGRALWSSVVGAAPAPGEDAAVRAPVSRVQFVPAAGPFTVTVAVEQMGGTLVLERTRSEAAAAWVDGAAEDADIVVLPSELRIHNRADAVSSYHLQLPSAISEVSVRIGGATRRVVVPATLQLGRNAATGSLSGQEAQP